MRRLAAAGWLVLGAAGPAFASAPAADLILSHGRIYTEDAGRPWAQALAVRGTRLVAVGRESDVMAWRGPHTRIVDLDGALVTPGLIDVHVHFGEGGAYLRNVPLRDARTLAEVRQRVADHARAHPGRDWIQGEGWSYSYPDLPGGRFAHAMLDDVGGHHPVFLNCGMAHAAWVNAEALRRAGIDRHTPDPPGGEIVRDADGEPTGWLKEEAAIDLVQRRIPAPPPAEQRARLLAAIAQANSLGITRVDSAGGDFASLPLLARLAREGRLTLRFSMADLIEAPGLSEAEFAKLKAARSRYRGDTLSCCVAKFILDGVLESHTAYVPGGYADDPAQTGMRLFEPEAFRASVARLNAAGFQVYTHAIGDGAIRLALDAYEAAQRSPGLAPPRNRIEHAEMPAAQDIARFGSLGVIASVQPLMIYPRDEWQGMEGLWARYAGEAAVPRAFPLRAYLDAGARIAFGTDWPIVQLNPLLGIRNAVLRQSLDGQPPGGYVPAQRVSIAEAVRAYTLDAAYASRRERDEGSLEAGKLADLVVYTRNFIEGEPDAIATAAVSMTLVGGRIVYRAARHD